MGAEPEVRGPVTTRWTGRKPYADLQPQGHRAVSGGAGAPAEVILPQGVPWNLDPKGSARTGLQLSPLTRLGKKEDGRSVLAYTSGP